MNCKSCLIVYCCLFFNNKFCFLCSQRLAKDLCLKMFVTNKNADINFYPTDDEMATAMAEHLRMKEERRNGFYNLLKLSRERTNALREKFNERRGKLSGPARHVVLPGLGYYLKWDTKLDDATKLELGALMPKSALSAEELYTTFFGKLPSCIVSGIFCN